jgi:hypothetical protein
LPPPPPPPVADTWPLEQPAKRTAAVPNARTSQFCWIAREPPGLRTTLVDIGTFGEDGALANNKVTIFDRQWL